MDKLKSMPFEQAISILKKAVKQGGTFVFVEDFETAANLAIEALNHCPAPENKPLTLDQLRQMDGEPVYIVVNGRPDLNAWHMVRRTDVGIIAIGAASQTIYNYDGKLNFEGSTYYDIEHGNLYGKTWLAYARKPEVE